MPSTATRTKAKYQPERAAARREILEAVNTHRRVRLAARWRHGILLPRLYAKDLQHAVHIARQNFLVSDELLRLAGFSPKQYAGKLSETRSQIERELRAIETGDDLWAV